jgi:UDP-N-acetylglucosamine--N-acetylmuramyl-(pentapeptide) pyrophosphoryl-undecaprenol N-acetylglucosamine transferase
MMKVLIMAGGTGGHVFPGLAVAEELRRRGISVAWLGTQRGIEARLVPAAGIELHWVGARGLRGKGWLAWLLAPLRLVWMLCEALALVRRLRPAVALGMGGYASGPGGLAARLLGHRLVIHEQNAVPGLTNRLLARIADRVLEGFPRSFAAHFAAEFIGNPVRAAIAALPAPEQRLNGRQGPPPRLLVLGGSQGARALNTVLPRALGRLHEEALAFSVRHQTGSAGLETTKRAYTAARIDAKVTAFIDAMAEAYAWADIVVCRAGALTIAELAAAGLGAVLVPYPTAVDDHQTANARYLVEANAAVLLPEAELTEARLTVLLGSLLRDRARLQAMAARARARAHADAAARVAEHCLALAGET